MLALTACEKPAPQVTVHSGGTVINIDAVRYCHEADKCRDHSAETPTLRVRDGESISFNVPTHVAEEGWYLRQGDASTPVQKKLHYWLDVDRLAGDQTFEIVEGAPGEQPRGVWKL